MKKRLVSLLLCVALCVCLLPCVAMAEGGTFGNGLKWNYDEGSATLTISGTGEMPNFEQDPSKTFYTNSPWTDYYKSVKRVVVEEGVTTLGTYAFADFHVLTEVSLPSTLTTIGTRVFSNCKTLTSIVIPKNVTTIDSLSFYFCKELASITLPEGLTSIGRSAFQYCYALKSVKLPESVGLAAAAFQDCKSLVSINLPTKMKGVGISTFKGTALTELILHEGIKSLSSHSYSECLSLKAVYLPKSLKSISDNAFEDSINITDVYYAGTEEEWKNVSIQEKGNEPLLAAKFHFNAAPTPDFTDVAMEAWYYDTVKAAAKAGIIAGNADGTFNPNGNLSWAQAVTFAVRLDQYCKGEKVYSAADQTGDAWYSIYLEYALEKKLLKETPANMNAAINRGDAAILFAAALGEKEQVNNVAEGFFTDVPASGELHDAVYALAKAGICNGTGNGTFGVENTFKRSEVATIVARMAGLVNPAIIA